MSLATYLSFMTLTTSVCWLFWVFVLFTMNPVAGSWFAVAAFFTTLSLALLGSLSTLGFLLRSVTKKQSKIHDRVLISFRQSMWLTIILTVSLALLHMQLFTVVNGFLLVGSGALAELLSIMLSKK